VAGYHRTGGRVSPKSAPGTAIKRSKLKELNKNKSKKKAIEGITL
jgi:hypothetical protein